MYVKNVYQSLFPIYFVSKICGFTCFSLKNNGVSIHFYGYLYPLCFLLFFMTSVGSELSQRHAKDNDILYSAIDNLLTVETVLNTLVIGSLEMLYATKKMKWLKDLDILDKEMSNLKLNINIQGDFCRLTIISVISTIVAMSSSVFIFVVDILCFFPNSFHKITSNISYCVPILASNIMFLKCTMLLLVLRTRFKWVNRGILTWTCQFNDTHKTEMYNMENFSRQFQAVYFNEKRILFLDDLRMKYFRIHTLSDQLVKMYAFPLLFSFLQIFMTFQVYSLYFIKLPSTQFTQKTTPLYQFFGKGLIAISVLQLATLSIVGSMISVEAHATGSILNNIKCVSEDVNEYVKYFICQLFHNKVEITAYNVFDIRAALIFQVASALTSYLVLCVQLHI